MCPYSCGQMMFVLPIHFGIFLKKLLENQGNLHIALIHHQGVYSLVLRHPVRESYQVKREKSSLRCRLISMYGQQYFGITLQLKFSSDMVRFSQHSLFSQGLNTVFIQIEAEPSIILHPDFSWLLLESFWKEKVLEQKIF